MPVIEIELRQNGPTSTEAAIRKHRIPIDRPEAKGGEDRGPMGGELLLASLGGCFASNLFAAARAREVVLEGISISVSGALDDAPARFSAIRMRVSGAAAGSDGLEKLVTIAERACIVANTLRSALDLTIVVADAQ